jgi:4-amino-4-deoxy-L-arabinose transferase-like glycosyltransferase
MRFVPVRAGILGALFAAVITLPGLGNGTLWDNSETVYGEVAREVLRSGDWIVMHVNAQPWFVQPPLFFWIAAACAKIFGVTPFAMRLPAALATIAMGGALGYATARIAGARAGTIAAIVLSTSLMQAIVGRLAIMDALLDLFVGVAILCWFRALEPRPQRGDVPQHRAAAFLGGSLALALGVLAKGPVAPVIVVLVIGVWLIWERRSSAAVTLPKAATVAAAAVLFAAVAAPWFVLEAVRVGPRAAGELIGHYTVGRYTGVIENQSGPWWYYLPVLILGFFPWIAFVPVAAAGAIDTARTRDGSFERLALVWAIVPVVFFSFAQTKLPNYVALMLPALAILVALLFERLAAAPARRAAIWSAAAVVLLIGALGAAIAVFIGGNHLETATAFLIPQLEVLGGLLLAGSLATLAAIATQRGGTFAPYVLAATAGALVLFIAFVGEPAAEVFKPMPPLARTIAARRGPESVVAVRGVAGTYALMFALGPVVETVDDGTADFTAAMCADRDLYLVTRAGDVPALARLAAGRGRRSTALEQQDGDVLLHVDGPPCVEGSGAPMSHATAHGDH